MWFNFLKKKKPKSPEIKKIGLVLSSGAAKGLAHIGVIKALMEQGITIEGIAGSSIGALVGACWARDGDITRLERVVIDTDWKKVLRLLDINLALMFKGFASLDKVKELLQPLLGEVTFKDLKIPLAIVATALDTGEEIVIREGSVLEAVLSSIIIPGVFVPVKRNNRFLIDGGIVNPLPVNVVMDMGVDYIIASNVIIPPPRREMTKDNDVSLPQADSFIASSGHQPDRKLKEKYDRSPNIFSTLLQTFYAMSYKIVSGQIKVPDLLIVPQVRHISTLEFYRGPEAIEEGYRAAKHILARQNQVIKGGN